MNSHHATLEIIAPTINEAIEKGLAELQLNRDAVDIEILDAGLNASPDLRYACMIRTEDGKTATGNNEATIDMAIATNQNGFFFVTMQIESSLPDSQTPGPGPCSKLGGSHSEPAGPNQT